VVLLGDIVLASELGETLRRWEHEHEWRRFGDFVQRPEPRSPEPPLLVFLPSVAIRLTVEPGCVEDDNARGGEDGVGGVKDQRDDRHGIDEGEGDEREGKGGDHSAQHLYASLMPFRLPPGIPVGFSNYPCHLIAWEEPGKNRQRWWLEVCGRRPRRASTPGNVVLRCFLQREERRSGLNKDEEEV
jgi:hypothetical protein